jgi:hypothetical protein
MKTNNRMFARRITRILICTGLAIFLISIAIPPSVGLAQGKVKPEWVMPKHYPNGFDGMGRIDSISEDRGEIVIDERILRLSSLVEYHTPMASNVSSALFGPGSYIGYMINADRQITSIWLIEME